MNRIDQYFRDPTIDTPATDYYIVRLPWDCFVIDRADAARVIEAWCAVDAPSVVRCQTVFGSVVYIRTKAIMSIRECTKDQRDVERRFWKVIDDEEGYQDE